MRTSNEHYNLEDLQREDSSLVLCHALADRSIVYEGICLLWSAAGPIAELYSNKLLVSRATSIWDLYTLWSRGLRRRSRNRLYCQKKGRLGLESWQVLEMFHTTLVRRSLVLDKVYTTLVRRSLVLDKVHTTLVRRSQVLDKVHTTLVRRSQVLDKVHTTLVRRSLVLDKVLDKVHTTLVRRSQVLDKVHTTLVRRSQVLDKVHTTLVRRDEEGRILEVIYLRLRRRRVGNYLGNTSLNRSNWDWNPDIPVISRLVQHESDALARSATGCRGQPPKTAHYIVNTPITCEGEFIPLGY
uniref:Uncharacterized protein n=1 Tax=Timema bartmani TaxID=61472 RepID=A0A7R9FBK0_9NEOP|nr:unnamed protein product [Timema bartmani]